VRRDASLEIFPDSGIAPTIVGAASCGTLRVHTAATRRLMHAAAIGGLRNHIRTCVFPANRSHVRILHTQHHGQRVGSASANGEKLCAVDLDEPIERVSVLGGGDVHAGLGGGSLVLTHDGEVAATLVVSCVDLLVGDQRFE